MGMTTLCYIENGDKWLMMHRVIKKNDINKDKWIGVGGHFEHGESPEECLLRETKEETGLTLTSYRFAGIVTFLSDLGTPQEAIEYMCLYDSDGYEGEIKTCDEGILEWVDKKDVFGLELWEGDKIFLDLLMQKVPFFSLKLEYVKGELIEAVLDGERIR